MVKENIGVPRDQEMRLSAIESTGNTIVLASAGSGKTRLLIDKLSYDTTSNETYQTFAAITFTHKAAKEIRQRNNAIRSDIFIGTIDGFLEKEVIEPFIRLLYKEISVYQFSYQRQHKFHTFQEGINKIKYQHVFSTYSDRVQKSGKNFKCEVALKLLTEIPFAREYLMYKYQRIFIDEYQDCDSSMNYFFQYLRDNLGIKLFIVGDIKQSLYQWRGASPKYLRDLSQNSTFEVFQLTENFRSNPDIVDFSNAISTELEVEEIAPLSSIYYYTPTIYNTKFEIIKHFIENSFIDLSKKIFILLGRNIDISNLYSELNTEYPGVFKYVSHNNISACPNKLILEGIAKYFFDENYSEYDFLENLYFEYDRIFAKTVRQKLESIVSNPSNDNIETLFFDLDIPVATFDNELESIILEKVLKNDANKIIYLPEDSEAKLILTTHSSKGLEADTVVNFVEYYLWNSQLNHETNYVGITRAENKLIIIDNPKQQYKESINKVLLSNNKSYVSLDDFVEIIDTF